MSSMLRSCRSMLLLLLASTVFSVAMVSINYNRLFPKYSTVQDTDCSKCTKLCVDNDLEDGQLRHTGGVAEGGNIARSSSVKHDKLSTEKHTVFNFGQLLRGREKQNEKNNVEELSADDVAELKAKNLCPKAYRLAEDFVKQHDKIMHTSSYTLATQNHTTSQFNASAVNSSVVMDIIASKPRIVILTPISSSAVNLQHYFKLLCSLTYPHYRISIALGEDSSTDRSYELAHVHSRTMKHYFHRVDVHHFDDVAPESHFGKHDEFFQLKRRGHLARARNQLLSRGLHDEDYVLLIDADVKYVPPDIIEHLLAADKDVIVPSCMTQNNDGTLTVYDRNSWRETERSRTFLSKQRPDFLKLEGYTNSMRDLLPDIKSDGHLVQLDGVGGCVMMVKAQCHRKGLIFPPFVFEHHIETEGLAKMAKTMNFNVYGYPFVFVCHW